MTVASYYGYLIGIVDSEMGIYEDEEIGNRFRERKSR